ncbi:MAG TPA: hypothetical protein VFH51_19480, partial [Myxococcota bacterium]|nr:hypothetical protein [Myxococcota bacterium]
NLQVQRHADPGRSTIQSAACAAGAILCLIPGAVVTPLAVKHPLSNDDPLQTPTAWCSGMIAAWVLGGAAAIVFAASALAGLATRESCKFGPALDALRSDAFSLLGVCETLGESQALVKQLGTMGVLQKKGKQRVASLEDLEQKVATLDLGGRQLSDTQRQRVCDILTAQHGYAQHRDDLLAQRSDVGRQIDAAVAALTRRTGRNFLEIAMPGDPEVRHLKDLQRRAYNLNKALQDTARVVEG